ncbi:MAG TPA: hypothetical protein VJ953_18550 [Saprospiraceae bacterium]|nr:hypothetical protein [Saprospiraceae bacterium]
MNYFKKYAPIVLALVGVVTLYLNYDQWRMMKTKDCDCEKEKQDALGIIE